MNKTLAQHRKCKCCQSRSRSSGCSFVLKAERAREVTCCSSVPAWELGGSERNE